MAQLHDAPSLLTERLKLRAWRDGDLEPFAAMNADARVVELLPSALTREQSDAMARRIVDGFDKRGFGLWAVERTDLDGRPFIGFVGLSVPSFDADFMPCVEVGWRLAWAHWGAGLATEAARAVVAYAFGAAGLEEVVSFTVVENQASRRIMEKLGMRHDAAEDFNHPKLPPGDRLERHVLYRLRRDA